MIRDIDEFRAALRTLLLSDDGISIESEGTVYVRSLEGNYFAAGILSANGGIESEEDCDSDIDRAISFFIEERQRRNHGSAW
jgi:hypothetical protein